jgi:hypothetical protein
MRKNLVRFASEDSSGNAATAVRTHRYDIAMLSLRGFDDYFVRVFSFDMNGFDLHAG